MSLVGHIVRAYAVTRGQSTDTMPPYTMDAPSIRREMEKLSEKLTRMQARACSPRSSVSAIQDKDSTEVTSTAAMI